MTKTNTVLYIASDHQGYALKQKLLAWGIDERHAIIDLGPDSPDAVDYPDFLQALVMHLKQAPESRGILICGTGIGMSIGANRFPWIRAALCRSADDVQSAREHNDANVLCLGRDLSDDKVMSMVRVFLSTDFSVEERHARRVKKISAVPAC